MLLCTVVANLGRVTLSADVAIVVAMEAFFSLCLRGHRVGIDVSGPPMPFWQRLWHWLSLGL